MYLQINKNSKGGNNQNDLINEHKHYKFPAWKAKLDYNIRMYNWEAILGTHNSYYIVFKHI